MGDTGRVILETPECSSANREEGVEIKATSMDEVKGAWLKRQGVDDEVIQWLVARAKRGDRSLSAEVRRVLRRAMYLMREEDD